ncbi:osteocalcin 2-like [Anopheles cruzii]|uniref:osteocalcin 2-like n=1 Tax=Anopheles cruzii TaxID=68878 RepID=UPI0022EC2A7B|nr:osteocalcin 2-like [Anopheles cruzii]
MFSCCRCVNPKSPKQKEKLAAGKGDKNGESESESEEQHTKQPKSNEAPPATVSHLPTAVDNLSQDDEEIKIEIIENSDNPPSSSGGSAATTAALNGGRSPAEPTSEAAPTGTQSPLDTRHPAESEPAAAPGSVDTERAASSSNLDAASASSSSPASKTPSNLASGQSSSAVVTEIEAQPTAHNESTDAESTGDATNTPQEIPTTTKPRPMMRRKHQLSSRTRPKDGDRTNSCTRRATPPNRTQSMIRPKAKGRWNHQHRLVL